MNRPLIPLSMAFGLGLFLSRQGSWNILFIVCPLFFFAAVIPFIRKSTHFMGLLTCGFLFLGVLAGSVHQAKAEENPVLRHAGRTRLTGRVQSWPEVAVNGRRETVSFVFSSREAGKIQVFLINSRARPEYGDNWLLEGQLKTPDPALYPGQFDYRRFLKGRGIRFVFRAYGRRSARLLKRGPVSLPGRVIKIRAAIKERIDRFFRFPEREIMAALLIGFQKKIPESVRNDFARTGTAHLLAVSGLNVSIVGGLLYFLLRFFLPRKANAFFSVCLVFFYAAISGLNAPVLRAGVMAGILLFGVMMDKDPEITNSLAAAFLLLLVMDAEYLFSAGFQLSFLSVLGMILLLKKDTEARDIAGKSAGVLRGLRHILGFFQGILGATFAATAATLPLVVYYFRLISPVSFLANLALVPLMNFATFLGFLALPLFFIKPDWGDAAALIPFLAIKAALDVNSSLARLPFASLHVPSPPAFMIVIYYAAILLFVLTPAGRKMKIRSAWAVACLAVCLIVAAVYGTALCRDTELTVHSLHLKQSSVTLIEFPGRKRTLLVNTGKSRPGSEWERIVKPFLMSRGIQTVDAVVLSSCRVKNSGGLEDLIEEFNSREIFLPLEPGGEKGAARKVLALIRQKNLRFEFLSHGRLIENHAGVQLRWLDNGSPGLELCYRGRRRVIPAEGFHKSLVESFCLR